MKKFSILIVVLLAVFVLCLPVATYAIDVSTVSLYGAYVGSSASGWQRMDVFPFGGNVFGYKPFDNPMQNIIYVTYYLRFPKTVVHSFSIDITDFYAYENLGNWGPNNIWLGYNGAMSLNLTGVVNYTPTANETGWNLHWDYQGVNTEEFDSIRLTYRVNSTGMSATYWHKFSIDNFVINGINADEIAYVQVNEDFVDDISSLSTNENEWWQRVVLPDYEDYLDNPDIINQSGTYRLAIKEISFNNFLVPGLISIVFILAFYGFLLYGKKG